MDDTTVREALVDSSFGAGLTPAEVEVLCGGARLRNYPAGTVVFREGEPARSFYLVHRGHVALEMCLPARGCRRLLTVGPGDFLAWSALLGSGPMTAGATAIEDAELIEFAGAELRKRCDADPMLGYAVMLRLSRALADRLLATRLQLLDLFSGQTFDGIDSP